jgi:RNA polymerase sigma factor (sigma-70 family)
MQNRSNTELMRLVLDKRREALEELYDRYVRLVYSFALKSTKDEGSARIIVQSVFTRLWTTEKGYDETKGEFVNWLLTVTRNCMIDEVRKEKRHLDYVQLAPTEWNSITDRSEETDPQEMVLRQVSKEQIQQAMKRLSESQNRLLRLFYWEGYTLREIAEINNEPLGTIKSRLHQTLKTLRNGMLPEREGSS